MKETLVAYVLWLFFGIFGIHRFYLDRPASGLLYMFTLGFLGIGWFIDLFYIPYMVDECNMRHYYEDVGYPGYPDYASGGSYYHHKAHPHQLISTPPPPPPPTHHSHLNPPPTQYGGY